MKEETETLQNLEVRREGQKHETMSFGHVRTVGLMMFLNF